ncbi:MAG: HAMP domain-containing protein [Elusimicrobiaceae bacterium]|nr:HAMP domain-containing protein [Elusimicrobiaceae bacterium]
MVKKKFRGLFFNAVLALSLISLVPLIFIGLHLTRVNSRVLQHEIFQKEQVVAGRLSAIVHTYITHVSEFFSVFIDLHTEFGGHAFLNQEDLSYLRAKNPSISYLALLDRKGKMLLSAGNPPTTDYQTLLPEMIKSCIVRKENYWGPVSFSAQRGWLASMAFPVYESLNNKFVAGILVVQVSLQPLGQALLQAYPLEMEAFIVNAKQEVVAYNGAAGGVTDTISDKLNQQIRAIHEELGGNLTGEVKLPDGRKWLVASANLILPGWKVYVGQPANITSKLVLESTVRSYGGVLRIALIMLLFILGVSYWVIIPITRPLERLRKAALRLREGDEIIRREEIDIPKNEIGDLAEVLIETSESLHARREDLLSAQKMLSSTNQDLEQRVEERTRELKALTGQLVKNERLATMGQMASIISHEIRNPLAVISNATRLIKMLLKNPDVKVEKQISIIESEIKQANSIIGEVLGYVRSRDLILSKVEINSYVHDVLASYPLPSGIKLVERLEASNANVKIDTEEMKQAIRNIIANAVEAMQNQGTLTVGTRSGRRMVCIYITDTGPGIAVDIRQKIFSPFFTTKARGTGLGLAVVGKAIMRHQGKMFIKSKEGEGACFQIYLKIYHNPGDTCYGEIG